MHSVCVNDSQYEDVCTDCRSIGSYFNIPPGTLGSKPEDNFNIRGNSLHFDVRFINSQTKQSYYLLWFAELKWFSAAPSIN